MSALENGWLAAVVASSADAIVGKDVEGRVIFWNDAAEVLFGVPRMRALGARFEELVPAEHPDDLGAVCARVLRGETTRALDQVRRRPDGTLIELSIAVSPVFDADGGLVGCALVARGTADARRLEERLRHAERLALLGTLAASLAHEMNGPITTILLVTEALAAGLAGGRFATEATTLREAALHLRALAADTRVAARADAGAGEVLPLGESVGLALRLSAAYVAARAKVVLTEASAPTVRADSARLAQVFLNLLINAADAIEARGDARGVIHVTLGTDERGDGLVVVEDDGAGMTSEILLRAREPFFTTKSEGRGTGLGLAISDEIVRELGGSLTLASTLGKGTTVTVRLPRSTEGGGRPSRDRT
jgi:PAS domain S-box-containing protein